MLLEWEEEEEVAAMYPLLLLLVNLIQTQHLHWVPQGLVLEAWK
jgi:hypothetical protein